jgi:CheY-like chemotaxis protein
MDADVRARLFEPYFTTKASGEGGGLGLSIVHGIVRQSRGEIQVESTSGRGTTFRLSFPIDRAAPAAPASVEPVTSLESESRTILVVDDQESILRLARSILEGQGYQVLVAASPADALETARRYPGPIAVLVSDLMMPGMDGGTLAERILERRPDIAVLFMSGYADDAIRLVGRWSASGFLSKPFTPTGLLKMVRDVVDRRAHPES